MPLGTLDRSPPPFFRQGLPARTKLVLFSALSVFLMAADSRLALVQPLRATTATALRPVVQALSLPVAAWSAAGDYLGGLQAARASEDAARARLAAQAERAARSDQLAIENSRLRALLELRPALQVKSVAAEVLYQAPDPFSHKLFLDRGSQQDIAPGSPVVNESGVLGQVTRVYPWSAEVTLLVDKDAAIPVVNTRTQHRSAAFGSGDGGTLELRFVAGNDDVRAGDELVTSGGDGVYPAGLPVATVLSVDRRADSAFARISLTPSAQPDGVRHVLVLEPLAMQLPPRPEPAASEPATGRAAAKPAKGASQ